MRNFFIFVLLISSICIQAQSENVIPPKPSASEGLVIDKTKTLTPEQESHLEQKLVAYDDSTSNQVAIVIISTTGNYSVEDVALEILRKWGVGGQAEKDNGIVILVAKDDRKMRIEVGYGLEGAISDYIAKTIIDNDIVPNFKQNNYYRGLDEAVNSIMEAAAGRYKAPEGYRKDKKNVTGWSIFWVILITWILMGLLSRGGRGGGGYVSRRGSRGWIGPTWTGGGGWSGGSSSGGFGGFGGGGGGGGGASGSW